MSELVNSELFERAREAIDSGYASKSQIDVIGDLIAINDLEGLWFAMKYIEQDIEDRRLVGAENSS